MEMIILTPEQAELVRGNHGKYSALDPTPTDDGNFILPVDVLDDPEHQEVFNKLGECKYADIDIIEVIDDKLPNDDIEKFKQTLSVKEISPVSIAAEKSMTVKPVYEKVIKQK